ncbi:MAG TPA: hypothetical protein VLC79_11340 [Cellvibrio sp.]|nr:hypothetical protein [Cellvibrio sp.]
MISRMLAIWLCVSVLSACGGGGGGSDGDKGDPPAQMINKPTANAGDDLVVNMYGRVDLDPKVLVANGTSASLNAKGLEISGSSDNKEAIVKLVWTKIEGPDIALMSSGFNDGKIYFIAPPTNGASVVKIVFKLTLTNAGGLSAEDTITILVNRVNQAPVAKAGDDIVVLSGDTVTLRNAYSSDADGTIVKFQWSQTSGAAVVLNNPATMESTFDTPIVKEETALEFELRVEDNDGKTATDRVQVIVRPRDTPEVQLHFPPAKGIYTEGAISLFGKVSSPFSTIASLSVDAGNGSVAAQVQSDGSWRLDNLALPTGVADISIVVTATDVEGRKGIARSQLQTSTNVSVGVGQSWDKIAGINVDPALNKLWMLTYDDTDMKLLSISLESGDRSHTVSDFSNADQGVSTRSPGHIIFDGYLNRIYMSSLDANDAGQIIGIDTVSGSRYLVSDATRGAGPALELPVGLALGNHETLFVADNHTSSIVAVDLITGNRRVVADGSTMDYGIDAPLFLANKRFDEANRLFIAPHSNRVYFFELDLSGEPVTNSLVFDGSNSDTFAMGEVEGLAFNSSTNSLYFYTFFEGLTAVNLTTNEKKELLGSGVLLDGLAFDELHGVLYAVRGFPEVLYAVDPVSGSKVIISKPDAY